MGKSVFGLGLQFLRQNILLNAELQKRRVENAELSVALLVVVGNSRLENEQVHESRVTRMQLDVLITLTMVTPVFSVMTTGSIALAIGDIGEAPSVMESKINTKKFTAMIDSGSPVTIFTTKGLMEILTTNVLFVRPLRQFEKNVDFNQRPLDIAGFIHMHLKIGKQDLKRTRL